MGHFDTWVQRPVSNKLLVLVDGRVVYTPTFGGVFWDVQDLLLEDVERIEVIRGPGGTLWGENVVNGVINVITKTAGETRGTFAEAGTHSMDGGFVGTRYGGGLGTTGDYRVYAKYFHRAYEAGAETTAGRMDAGQRRVSTGLARGARDTLSVQGAGYWRSLLNGRDVLLVPPFSSTVEHPGPVDGGNIQTQWARRYNGDAELRLQADVERTSRSSPYFAERRTTATLNLQHHVRPSGRHDLVWGAAYARSADRLNGSFRLSFVPTEDSFVVGSGFVQDDITLVPDRLRVVAGTKILHNTYTGWEQQPNARVLWTPNQDRSLWFAVSRAVRLPTRVEEGVRLNTAVQLIAAPPGVGLVRLQGAPGGEAEHATAYELGYRMQVAAPWFVDLAVYRNTYTKLNSVLSGTPFLEASPGPVHVVMPVGYSNSGSGHADGAELFTRWQASGPWRVSASYTWSQMQVSPLNTLNANVNPGLNPSHRARVQAAFDLPYRLQWDVGVSHTSRLRATGVPAYAQVDTRLAWRPRGPVEIDLVARNLFDAAHVEWIPVGGGAMYQNIEVPRSVVARVTWRR